MGGLSTEASYPYISGGGSNYPCSKTKFKPVVKVANYIDLPSNTLAPVLQHVATTGPLAISVDASTWSDYGSGVFDGCNNVNPDLDHAVQVCSPPLVSFSLLVFLLYFFLVFLLISFSFRFLLVSLIFLY